jgi:hypothetical protein
MGPSIPCNRRLRLALAPLRVPSRLRAPPRRRSSVAAPRSIAACSATPPRSCARRTCHRSRAASSAAPVHQPPEPPALSAQPSAPPPRASESHPSHAPSSRRCHRDHGSRFAGPACPPRAHVNVAFIAAASDRLRVIASRAARAARHTRDADGSQRLATDPPPAGALRPGARPARAPLPPRARCSTASSRGDGPLRHQVELFRDDNATHLFTLGLSPGHQTTSRTSAWWSPRHRGIRLLS